MIVDIKEKLKTINEGNVVSRLQCRTTLLLLLSVHPEFSGSIFVESQD